MPVDRRENLIPQSMRSKEEQRKIASMGGKKSVEVRREKKRISQMYAEFLSTKQEIDIDGVKVELEGQDLLNHVIARVVGRGDSASVSMLKEIREATDTIPEETTKVDPDLLKYKIYTRAFDRQQQVLASKSKDIGLMCGRRAGKSDTNRRLAITKALEGKGKRVLIVGLTIGQTIQIYEYDILELCREIGISAKKNSVHGYIELGEDSIIQFGGTSTRAEKEKYRGQHWDLIIIDEAQSQPGLGSFLEEIINPMLVDTNGNLIMTGTGPRVRGTYWERFYLNPSPSGLRLNWNLSHNPFIHDYQHALQTIRDKYQYTDTDPIYLREYLGQVVYDDDALVLRMGERNYWTREQIGQWIAGQSPADVRFVAGLDYGFRDSDAFAIVMYSESRNEKFVVYEHKANGQDVTELYQAIQNGKQFIETDPLFAEVYNKAFDIYADTSDQKIGLEFRNRYGLPVLPAIKHDKALALSMLQDEVRRGNLKTVQGGPLDIEAQRTVYKRIEQDGGESILTREIDHELYHPDLMDALLYALRGYWLTHYPDHYAQSDRPHQTETPELLNYLAHKRNEGPETF